MDTMVTAPHLSFSALEVESILKMYIFTNDESKAGALKYVVSKIYS
jgi:hypothetical protein